MHEKRCEFSWWRDNKEITIINWGALYYAFGTSNITYEVVQHLECYLMLKAKQFNVSKKQNVVN